MIQVWYSLGRISGASVINRMCISNYMWDVSLNPRSNLKCGLLKPTLKLRHPIENYGSNYLTMPSAQLIPVSENGICYLGKVLDEIT